MTMSYYDWEYAFITGHGWILQDGGPTILEGEDLNESTNLCEKKNRLKRE